MLAFCGLLICLLTMMPPRLVLDRKRGVILLGAYLLFVVSLFL
jgi:Ca2+/Na+ antiporter